MDTARRPSPEEMLARAAAEEAREKRGQLKIFFGASPGVGKTYAMLTAALARKKEGIDVVIGWVDTHGRKETEALTEGLERLPPRVVDYRGLRIEEFDLEGALRRNPPLILVDELAHTNAAGSRHTRRWQDVQELLDAKIDVYTTLNVQHLESLNDVVAQIAGVSVRETVPDSIFELASEVALVDLPPDDLLQRLREGKVYVPAQIQRAIDNFFRKGNLIALRELALRRTAERVDAQMATWKHEQGVVQPWLIRERILVAIGPAPQSADLVRSACRMARRLQAPWIALSVETPGFHNLPVEDRERVAAHLTFAERMGAERLVIAAEDVAEAILGVARERNVSRIVVGKPSQAGWRHWLRGSLVDRLVRISGPIDVLVTRGEAELEPRRTPSAPRAPFPLGEYGWAALAVLASTALCWLGRPIFDVADLAMIYLLAVLFVAARFSRGPALFASLASVAAFDFFFIPPYFTFAISDVRYVVTFGVMLGTGFLVSHLTLRIRQQAQAAREREQRTAVLYAMTRTFAYYSSVAEIAEAAARHVEILFEAETSVLLAEEDGSLALRGGTSGELVQSERELAVAKWVVQHGRPAGRGTDTLGAATGLYLPITGGKGTIGVLAIALGKRTRPLTPAEMQLLEVFVGQSALALERALLTQEAQAARVAVETERIRNALLSSVSHDLRTPLASVTGAATSLLDDGGRLDDASRRELLETIRDEGERLSRVVSDLLEISRLESGTFTVRKEWYPLEEIIASALARLEEKLGGREVRIDLPSQVLQVPIDAALAEQVFINLLENAVKYTPPRSAIEVSARRQGDEVQVEVRDRGPGIPPGDEEKVFERFYRASGAGGSGGFGLGLAVCRAVVKAHGGSIRAENREGGGAVFRFTLPLQGEPPALREDPEIPAVVDP